MIAEVISIGDELSSGQRLDTNSQWLSLSLGELGVTTRFHTTVADDLNANIAVFRNAIDRADIVLATGGLGPTADDLTRQAIAEATECELLLDSASLEHIRSLFARRKRDMPSKNEIQAFFPKGSIPIHNPHGSAPGIDFKIQTPNGRSRLFALPGVPAEMKEMWNESVGPAISELIGKDRRFIQQKTLKCFGIGESDMEAMLPDVIRRGREPTVGITVSQATISLRITAIGTSPAHCQTVIQPTLHTIKACLGDLVFGEDEEELPHVVGRLLKEQGETLAIAECGTGGLISQWLSDVDPTGETYVGGVSLRNQSQLDHWIDTHQKETRASTYLNANESVKRLSSLVRAEFNSDYGLAISLFPQHDTVDQGPEPVFFASADSNGIEVNSKPFAGHPDILKSRAAKQALDFVRLQLQKR